MQLASRLVLSRIQQLFSLTLGPTYSTTQSPPSTDNTCTLPPYMIPPPKAEALRPSKQEVVDEIGLLPEAEG
ncbi:hypothetical protein MTR_5g094645 [Medicago truncatula]|uniref:Uncharacterized protein n=1 Tax=Medicago truncatula TaxID=3880 RepID=A0A072UGB0_MEDTR|nr:hypothetical protein MTR_5g094645 [Medicago truncatula]